MTELINLKRRLAVATDLRRRTTDRIERSLLGGDVRELEKLVELASDDASLPRRLHVRSLT